MLGKHRLVALTALTVAVLLLIAARPMQAQTETVIYTFCSLWNCEDGLFPRVTSPLTTEASMGQPPTGVRINGLRRTLVEPYLSFRRTAAEAGTRLRSTFSAPKVVAKRDRLPRC
jgi:hypothetical protein